MTLEEAHAKWQRENKKHMPRWHHEFQLVKAWLASGGRVIPTKYDGYGFYLYQEGEYIYGSHSYSKSKSDKKIPFCKADNGLMDEGFIIIPNNHAIRHGRVCPEWFMRTGEK